MTMTIDKLLADSQHLVRKLQEKDSRVDILLTSADALNRRVQAMQLFEEKMVALSAVTKQRPRSALIIGLVREGRQIRQLENENRELVQSIEEHQTVLHLIMQRYREQVDQLIRHNRLEKAALQQKFNIHNMEVQKHLEKIHEMISVMKQAASADDQHYKTCNEELERLQNENKGLRELLQIGSDIGGKICLQPDSSKLESSEPLTCTSGSSEISVIENDNYLPPNSDTVD